jgi:hypothetical protein
VTSIGTPPVWGAAPEFTVGAPYCCWVDIPKCGYPSDGLRPQMSDWLISLPAMFQVNDGTQWYMDCIIYDYIMIIYYVYIYISHTWVFDVRIILMAAGIQI